MTNMRFLFLISVLSCGCSVVVDTDRFEQARDFQAFVTNMQDFVDTPFLVTLFDDADGEVDARALMTGVFLADAMGDGVPIRVIGAVDPNKSYDVLVIADVNGDGTFTVNADACDDSTPPMPVMDATWVQTEVVNGVASIRGGCEAVVTTADPPREPRTDFVYTLLDFSGASGPHGNQLFELAVIDLDTGLGIGSHFRRAIDPNPMSTQFTVRLPGIIEDGHRYEVQLYADLDESQNLTNGDHRWREEYTASGGLAETFVHAAPFTAELDAF